MKLNPNVVSQHQISEERLLEGKFWEHPWNKHMKEWDAEKELDKRLKRPKPATKEAKEKAKFKDKTYHWEGR